MDPDKAAARFLRQAARGVAYWRIQGRIAFALALGLALGGAYAVWMLSRSGLGVGDGLTQALLWLALSGGAAMWTLHCELMEGAAAHLAARRLADGPHVTTPPR